MKSRYTIALVVISILATVAIEESRISKMRTEINRLQAIPRDEPSDISDIVAKTVDLNDPAQNHVESAPAPEPIPEPKAATPPSPPADRVVPEEFPDPDDATIKQLAIGPNSNFSYEIGLNNRERAYLAFLLDRRSSLLQDTAAKWIAASPDERPRLENTMTLIVANSEDQIATFLGNEADAKAFADYHAMQPEREMLSSMSAALDEAGTTLPIEKEQELITSLYQARVGTGSLDWNSPAGLKAIAESDPQERFETEWENQTQALNGLLPKFLTESETAAVLQSREGMKEDMITSIESVVEAIDGGSE
jgi:hypothetical protein